VEPPPHAWRTLLNAFEGTMRTTAMIMAILLAAYFLNFVITFDRPDRSGEQLHHQPRPLEGATPGRRG